MCPPTTAPPCGRRFTPRAGARHGRVRHRTCTCCVRRRGYIIVGQDTDGNWSRPTMRVRAGRSVRTRRTSSGKRSLERASMRGCGSASSWWLSKTRDAGTLPEEGVQIRVARAAQKPPWSDRPRDLLRHHQQRPRSTRSRSPSSPAAVHGLRRIAGRAHARPAHLRSKSPRRFSTIPPEHASMAEYRSAPACCLIATTGWNGSGYRRWRALGVARRRRHAPSPTSSGGTHLPRPPARCRRSRHARNVVARTG